MRNPGAPLVLLPIRASVLGLFLARCLVSPHIADAATSFGKVEPVGDLAATDVPAPFPGDMYPALAGSATGTVVAAWRSLDSSVPANDDDVLVSRSTDSGLTWSSPSVIYGSPEDYQAPVVDIATDGSALWIAAVARYGIMSDPEIAVVRSTDDGQSWLTPINVSGIYSNFPGEPQIEVGANGTWIVAFTLAYPLGADHDLFFSRSTDDGMNWSVPQTLQPDDGMAGQSDSNCRLATNGTGTWVAVWDKHASPYVAHSTDDGQTWSVGTWLGTGTDSSGFSPDVIYDGNGSWVIVWSPFGIIPLEGDGGRLLYSRSTDGIAWTPQAHLAMPDHNFTDWDSYGPRLVADGDRLTATWISSRDNFGNTTGRDYDLLSADSYNGGVTWDPPMLLNVTGRRDSATDWEPAVASAGPGNLVVAWSSDNDLGGTIGTDLDIVRAVSQDDCPSLPQPGCITGTESASSRIKIEDGYKGKDALQWKWNDGGATTPPQLGSPDSSSRYVLCVYAKTAGSVRPVLEEDIPAGQTCDEVPCWTPRGDGFKYKDSRNDHGSVKTLRIEPGAAGDASLQVKASGPTVGPPSLPLDLSTPAKVQLLNLETGACWESTFSTASENTPTTFKAMSD